MNKSHLLLLVSLLLCIYSAEAQFKTVTLDSEMGSFGGHTPLPAQSQFQLKGTTEPFIDKISLEIYKNDFVGTPDYRSDWIRTYGYKNDAFTIPVYYRLRGNAKYSFKIKRFRKLEGQEKESLRQTVYQALDDYLDSQLRVRQRRLFFDRKPQQMVNNMNTIVNTGLQYFENNRGNFAGFSDLIKDKMKQMESMKVRKATLLDIRKDTATKPEAEVVQSEVASLKSLVRNELNYFLSEDMYRLVENKEIRDYETEKLPNVIGVNVGYAAVSLGGNWDNQRYGTAPYVGVSFPLGNYRKAPFMNRISISAGILLTDVKDQNDQTYTGAYISKPIYLGLGYKVFDFVRINAGAVMLEQSIANDGSNISIRPFVGLSADFSLWLGVGNKNK